MSWTSGVAIVMLVMGFAKLSTMIVNRLHAVPQPKSPSGLMEIIQLISIAVYFSILINGFVNHGLSFDDFAFSKLTTLELMMVMIGVVGFSLLVSSMIVYQLYRDPECQVANDSQVIDFRRGNNVLTWKTTLAGPGPMRRIALLPGNEQFTVEVSTKSFSLKGLPREWDGLSMVLLADTHFRGAVTCGYFKAVCEQAAALKPDLFIFSGDLLDDSSHLDWLPSTFGRLKAPLGQYFILGNHDWHLDTTPIRTEFQRHGWVDLSSRCMELASLTSGPPIVLAGDETPWMGTHPDTSDLSRDTFRILVSHTPDNISWARDQGFDLMLSGHTHGGQIRLPFVGPVYSPSRFGCRYASGAFWLPPTLLYVSRGISGREPIRYNCRPELTKIILRRSDDSLKERSRNS